MTVPRPPARHLALVAASLAFLPSFFAFAPPGPGPGPGRRLPLRPGLLDRRSNGGAALPASSSGSGSGSGSSPPPLPSDEASMRDLIASLSAEPTDEARRGRLAALMEEGLAAGGSEDGGGGGLGFVALFEETLQSVGREVQDAARLNALRRQERDQQRQRQRQRHRVEDDADADGGGGGGDRTALWLEDSSRRRRARRSSSCGR